MLEPYFLIALSLLVSIGIFADIRNRRKIENTEKVYSVFIRLSYHIDIPAGESNEGYPKNYSVNFHAYTHDVPDFLMDAINKICTSNEITEENIIIWKVIYHEIKTL